MHGVRRAIGRQACRARAAALVLMAMGVGLTVAGSAPAASDDGGELLKPTRWSETALGISMRPPKGTSEVEAGGGDAIVAFGKSAMAVKLFVRASSSVLISKPSKTEERDALGNPIYEQKTRHTDEVPDQLTRQFLRNRGQRQLAFLYPNAEQLPVSEPDFTVAGYKATKLYMQYQDNAGNEWVFGQAYVIIHPQRVVVFQLECKPEGWRQHKRAFEAMLKSVKITDVKKLRQQRGQLLKAGEDWLKSLSRERIEAALPKGQWYRITNDGDEVGYMRRDAEVVNRDGREGIRLTMQKRVVAGEVALDSRGEFFARLDGEGETWQLKTTRRPKTSDRSLDGGLPAAGRQTPRRPTWAATGVRDTQHTIVTRLTPTPRFERSTPRRGPADGGAGRRGGSGNDEVDMAKVPTGIGRKREKKRWPTPETAYLSQVGRRLYFALLPHDRRRRMLFYSYASSAGRITLQRVEVQPLKGDRFAVRVKPAPAQGESVSIYREDGTLIKRRLPSGNVIRPTSASKLRQLWDL